MNIPKTMQAITLNGHGGFEQLEQRANWPVPQPKADEVLIKVGAAAVNNTDINTRIGWYSKSVSGATGAGQAIESLAKDEGGWAGEPLPFPIIQGADICGTIVAVGAAISSSRIGERVITRTMQPMPANETGLVCFTLGSEINGGFAQYATIRSDMALKIECDLSDIELASFPCAASTAEAMLDRISLAKGERVLITGASGGVGSAAVQLAKRRGAYVIAIASASKHSFVLGLGVDEALGRGDSPAKNSVDVVVDLVAGPQWNTRIEALKRGGRYVVSGAIAGPICEMDLRTIYLNDITIAGSTYQPHHIMENLVRYIENGDIKPVVSKTYPLSQIVAAQTDFVAKKYPGKIVLVPDLTYKTML